MVQQEVFIPNKFLNDFTSFCRENGIFLRSFMPSNLYYRTTYIILDIETNNSMYGLDISNMIGEKLKEYESKRSKFQKLIDFLF